MSVTEMIVRMTIGEDDKDKPLNILDPCVGTGRFLVSAGMYAPNATLFGVDIDNRAIRTAAFTNACIHKLRVRLLCADSLRHATDLRTNAGRHNWSYCNQWQSHYGELKTLKDEYDELQEKLVVPKKVGFAEYQKKKAEQLSLFDYCVPIKP